MELIVNPIGNNFIGNVVDNKASDGLNNSMTNTMPCILVSWEKVNKSPHPSTSKYVKHVYHVISNSLKRVRTWMETF